MTDIVEWLRAYADQKTVIDLNRFNEAAAEIERLRAALKEIRDAGPMTLDDQRWRIALAALEGK